MRSFRKFAGLRNLSPVIALSLDIGDAAFLATGQDDGDIMDDTLEAKEDFYSRVIQLYTRDVTLTNSIYNR